MRISSLMLSLCAAALLVTGCAKNQMPAKKAVDQIEDSLKAVRADAEKYAPDGLKSVDAQLDRFKEDIKAKNYDDVVAGAPQLQKAVDSLQDAVASGKKHAEQAMEVAKTEWAALSEQVPKMVDTLDKRVAEIDKKKFFKGIKKDDFEAAKGQLETMKTTWAEATDAHRAGKTVAAADKAKTAKSMGDELYDKLDIKKT